MPGINKAIVVGNLGKDPEIRNTRGGDVVANFSLATSETYKDRDNNKRERTEWHNVVAWGRLAEIVNEYLHKGSKVYIEGKLQTDQFEKDGQAHYRTKIIAREMQMLDSRGEGQQQRRQEYRAPRQSSYDQRQAVTPDDGFGDEDVPF